MKKSAAFTLLEILIVVSILGILAALLQPTITSAIYSARVQSSASRLRQLAIAVHLYRFDNSLSGYSIDQFPHRGIVYQPYLGFGKRFFESPCGYKEGIEENLSRLSFQYVPINDPVATAHIAKHQENALLFRDPHCNTLEQWQSYFMTKRKLGVLVSGQIVNEMAAGSTIDLEWWLPRSIQSSAE